MYHVRRIKTCDAQRKILPKICSGYYILKQAINENEKILTFINKTTQ